MATININGKEYTKKQLLDGIYRNEHDESGLFETLCTFPRHEPEPPKLRPMSELPEENIFVNILIEHDTRFWGDGFVCLNRVELRYLGQDLWKQQDYKSDIGVKALGWLPKEELPNPNDIKL